MLGNSFSLVSLNSSQAGWGAQAGQFGLGLGLMQANPLADVGFDLQHMVQALPYLIGGGATLTALGLGARYAVRLWERHQASLPPAGMRDIRPERMAAFFEKNNQRPEIASVLMGFSGTALDATLQDTESKIASETADLSEALKTARDDKSQKRIEIALAAYADLQSFVSLRRGRTTRAREALLSNPEQVMESLIVRLSGLYAEQQTAAAHFFKNIYPNRQSAMPDAAPRPDIADHYASLDDKQMRQIGSLAVEVWRSLSPENKAFFWELPRPEDAPRSDIRRLPADFLTLFMHLLPKPTFPLNFSELTQHMPALVERRIAALRNGPELAPHFRDVGQGIVILRGGDPKTSRMMGQVQIRKRLGTATVRVIRDMERDGERQRFGDEFAPEDILTIRGPEHISQIHWTHPDIKLTGADGKGTAPGVVMDLKEYPAFSLGDEHRVLVDYSEPKALRFLRGLQKIREQMESAGISRQAVATKFWEFIQKKPSATDPGYIAERSGPGRLHALFDLADAGADSERALLIQMAFQFLGIPSRLEQGLPNIVTTRGVPPGEEPKGPSSVLWVRVTVPDRPQMVLCPRLDTAVMEGHPAFDSFEDQTVHSGPLAVSSNGSGPHARGRIETDPSADKTPLPEPLPPEPDADDEGVTNVIARDQIEGTPPPAPAPEPDPMPDPAPVSSPPESDRAEVTRIVPMEVIQSEAIRQDLIGEIQERYELFSKDRSDKTRDIAQSLADHILNKWTEAGRPALETDERNQPLRIPEQFLESTVNAWLDKMMKNTSEIAAYIVTNIGDRGSRSKRRQEASQPQAQIPASVARATPPPLPPQASEPPRRATPPPFPPDPAAVARAEAARLEAEKTYDVIAAIKSRYPAFQEASSHAVVTVLASKVRASTKDNPTALTETIEAWVQKMIPLMEATPANHNMLRGIRASDSITAELRERYPVFNEPEWATLAEEALQEIFIRWQIENSKIESGPNGQLLIPEDVFEAGFTNFTSKLSENYPDHDQDDFVAAFVDGDAGPRARRWAPPVEVDDTMHVADEELETVADETPAPSTRESSASPTTPSSPVTQDVSHVRERSDVDEAARAAGLIGGRYPSLLESQQVLKALAARVVKRAAGGDLAGAIDAEMSVFLRYMADTARANTPQEAIMRSVIEKDVADELRERYSAFASDASLSATVAAMTRRIYGIWNGNNRTFNGSVNALPLRIPEKFIDQGMNVLKDYLQKNDPSLADRIFGSWNGNRARREELRRNPSNPPPLNAIPISVTSVLLELHHRFPPLIAEPKIGPALARHIYQAWLREDPKRLLEQSGPGLRGLIPEAVLNSQLPAVYALMDRMNMTPLRRLMQAEDRKSREDRGTGVLEFEIEEAAREAAETSHNAA